MQIYILLRNKVTSWVIFCLIGLCILACQNRGAGDASCPGNTIRSGQFCLPYDDAQSELIPTSQSDMYMDIGERDAMSVDQNRDMGNKPTQNTYMIVDDYFIPSGFMGDGESGGISLTTDCPQRGGDGLGICHHFAHTVGEQGWGGVWWQNMDGNWGDTKGYLVSSGFTRIQFVAWGQEGGEVIHFLAGYGAADGFAVETVVELSNRPQIYSIDIAGVPYQEIAGGFAWYSTGESGDVSFYIDDIKYARDTTDEVQSCTVSCALLQAVDNCMGVDAYLSCQERCYSQLMSVCGEKKEEVLSCVGSDGYTCVNEEVMSVNDCVAQSDALELCQNEMIAPDIKTLPFYIEEYFIMSGYMGGGTVEVNSCIDDISADGTCLEITWLPEGSDWVGFFFQYPENNWGDQDGLAIESGATHLRYTTWVAEGVQQANFVVGINEADGFSQETGYFDIGEEREVYSISLPEGITEVTGGFAWFLENSNRLERVVFYLDDVQWRRDEVNQ